ncbi:acyl carrier protein-like protein [Fomitopsis serialis]|uniref:acyl carrier protein-like protein n=1 Tax=Fomitopsis serialis TaxID=139415 RepID=UPI002008B831|nr:acyl carrier protein-like protein [Neoantrodia serialis]KAH9937089.1 acyl carrier protein-like protein [Neoantrodia serialis]
MSFLRLATRSLPRSGALFAPRTASAIPQFRGRVFQTALFSAQAGLSKEVISARVVDVLKGFEKVDPTKLTETSRFSEDLGLDSLDAVEVVMAVEEEFAIEIPDEEADEIKTVQQAIDYIAKTPEAH